MKKLILASLAAIALNACSSGDDGGGRQRYEFDDRSTAQKVFRSSQITCDSNTCHEFIGGLTEYTETRRGYFVSVCSLTYIGNNQVLTNRHCIENDLRRSGVSCKNRVKIYFPAVGPHGAESFDCDKVENISPANLYGSVDASHPDWAILSFKGSTNRAAAKINRDDGLTPRQIVHTNSIFYHLDNSKEIIKVTGRARKNECSLSMRESSSLPYYFDAFSYIWYTNNDCTESFIHGNSGSGLFNTNNELVGVLNSGIEDANGNFLSGGGNNIACISHFGPTHPHCQYILNNDSYDSFIDRIRQMALSVYGEFNQNIITPNDEHQRLRETYLEPVFQVGAPHNIAFASLKYENESSISALNPSFIQLEQQRFIETTLIEPLTCAHRSQTQNKSSLVIPFKRMYEFDATPEDNSKPYEIIPVHVETSEINNQLVIKLQKTTDPALLRIFEPYAGIARSCTTPSLLRAFRCNSFVDADNLIKGLGTNTYTKINTLKILDVLKAQEITLTIPYCDTL